MSTKTRYCGWHKEKHPMGDFNAGQRYCKVAHRESKRKARGASEAAARGPGWRQGVKHKGER